MFSENTPDPATPDPEPIVAGDDIDAISPEDAEAALQQVLEPYLTDEWIVVHRDSYSARLTKGTRNLDFFVDLLGQVQTKESPLTPLQDSGRLLAWVLLWTMLLVALAVGTALGII